MTKMCVGMLNALKYVESVGLGLFEDPSLVELLLGRRLIHAALGRDNNY